MELQILVSGTTASHAVISATIALGIGIAIKLRRYIRWFALIVPLWLFVMGTLDHAAWNADYQFPEWILAFHEWHGSGYAAKPLLLILLGLALIFDYWQLNLTRDELMLFNGEKILNPFSEMYHLIRTFIIKRYTFWHLLTFYRQRRQLGFALLSGDQGIGNGATNKLQKNVNQHYKLLMAFAGILLLGILVTSGFLAGAVDNACVACIFEGLQSWWDRLDGLEKAAIALTAFGMTFPLLGFWSGIGFVATTTGMFASGDRIGAVVREPGKLRSPEFVLSAAVTIGLSRIPGGRLASAKLLKSARGMRRYEITTASGLRYRVTHGSNNELKSVFAKIEKRHLGTGTATNASSRNYARALGKKTDDAGHGIANSLGGPGGKYGKNIFPQNPAVNRGEFNRLEIKISKAVQNGNEVYVRVKPIYSQGSTRPYKVIYQYRLNGKTMSKIFNNP